MAKDLLEEGASLECRVYGAALTASIGFQLAEQASRLLLVPFCPHWVNDLLLDRRQCCVLSRITEDRVYGGDDGGGGELGEGTGVSHSSCIVYFKVKF